MTILLISLFLFNKPLIFEESLKILYIVDQKHHLRENEFIVDMFNGVWLADDRESSISKIENGRKRKIFGKVFFEKYIGKSSRNSVWVSPEKEIYVYNVFGPTIYKQVGQKMELVNRKKMHSSGLKFFVLDDGSIFYQQFVGHNLIYQEGKNNATRLSDVYMNPYKSKILLLTQHKGIKIGKHDFIEYDFIGDTIIGLDKWDNLYILKNNRGCENNWLEIFSFKLRKSFAFEIPVRFDLLHVDNEGKVFFTYYNDNFFALFTFEPEKFNKEIRKLIF